MNIVIFGNSKRGPRQFSLTSPSVIALASVTIGLVFSAVFALGFSVADQQGSSSDDTHIAALKAQLQEQEAQIIVARQKAEDTLDALAIQLGRMNAHVVRIDALGQRLTEMADLEDGEFDFETAPPIGGPEETDYLVDMDEAGLLGQLDALSSQLADRRKQLGVLESVLLTRNVSQAIHPQGRPVQGGWISSYFGTRTDPFTGKTARHKGVDFAGKAGADIVAVGAGIVTYSGNRYGYGMMVEIDHGNGYITRYAHNSENTVNVGEEVSKGQVIGFIGSTGRATGPNLHFEVIKDGQVQDPVKFIKAKSH